MQQEMQNFQLQTFKSYSVFNSDRSCKLIKVYSVNICCSGIIGSVALSIQETNASKHHGSFSKKTFPE